MKFALAILVCFAIQLRDTEIKAAQETIEKETLVKAIDELLKKYQAKVRSIQYTVTGEIGKERVHTENKLAFGQEFSYVTVDGTPSLAMGFNKDYGFQLFRKDNQSAWQVKNLSIKSQFPESYKQVRNSNYQVQGFLQVGLGDTELLKNLLEEDVVVIKEQKPLAKGAIKLKFASNILTDLKRDEYDLKKIRLMNNEDKLNEEEYRNAIIALGKRPTEIESLECTVESQKGFFVSQLKLRTVLEDGSKSDYSFQCGNLRPNQGLFIPKSYSTRKVSPHVNQQLKTVVRLVILNKADRLDSKPSRLTHYGLTEPD